MRSPPICHPTNKPAVIIRFINFLKHHISSRIRKEQVEFHIKLFIEFRNSLHSAMFIQLNLPSRKESSALVIIALITSIKQKDDRLLIKWSEMRKYIPLLPCVGFCTYYIRGQHNEVVRSVYEDALDHNCYICTISNSKNHYYNRRLTPHLCRNQLTELY